LFHTLDCHARQRDASVGVFCREAASGAIFCLTTQCLQHLKGEKTALNTSIGRYQEKNTPDRLFFLFSWTAEKIPPSQRGRKAFAQQEKLKIRASSQKYGKIFLFPNSRVEKWT